MTRILMALAIGACATAGRAADPGPNGASADGLVAAGLATAKKDKKVLFLAFGSPTCGWCKYLDKFHARPAASAILDKQLVFVKVDVVETPGGQKLYDRYAPEPGGVPVWVFLAADGRVLADSFAGGGAKKKRNVGFPSAPGEVAHYEQALRAALPKLPGGEVAKVVAELKAAGPNRKAEEATPAPAPVDRGEESKDEAARFVERLGGRVDRDAKRPGEPVTGVHLNGTAVTDQELGELAALTPRLEAVFLYDTSVSDAGVRKLAGLKQLSHLDLRNTKVTDAGMKDVATHRGLIFLNISGTRVTDAGLKEVGKLTELRSLSLGTEVTDAGLKELAGLKNLTGVIVRNRRTTAAGVDELRKALPKCEVIFTR